MSRLMRTMGLTVALLGAGTGAASAQVLYGTTGVDGGSSSLYILNTSTGLATLVGSAGISGIGSLSVSPGGILYGVANNAGRPLVTLNTTTGAATIVGSTLLGSVADIAFRSDGTLFAVTGGGALVYTISTTTGLATLVGNSGVTVAGGGLAFNSAGTLFLNAGSSLFTVNQTTGVATLAGTLNFSAFPSPGTSRFPGMKFHPTTGVLFGSVFPTPGRLGSASGTSGTIAVTNIGATGVDIEAVAFAAGVSVPVLPPWGLTALGILLAALVMWTIGRRRSSLETA